MDETTFQSRSPGRLARIPEGVSAFVPDPLPPKNIETDYKLANQLGEAGLALGELKGVGATLPNPHLLIGPLRRREAILSSKLEGTLTTAQELIMAEATPSGKHVRNEAHEVYNLSWHWSTVSNDCKSCQLAID